MKKIYITGCARSGTTLLARMFYAFNDSYVMNEEIQLNDFVRCCAEESGLNSIMVGKRTEYSIFSNILSQDDIEESLDYIEENNIIVINCVRDGRFLVDSWVKAWRMYNPFAWLSAIKQSIDYNNYIGLTIKYEDLVNNPFKVEQDIISLLGIDTKYCFEEYPEFVPEESFSTEDKNYILREIEPIDEEIVPPLTYTESPNDIKLFEKYLLHLGYEQ